MKVFYLFVSLCFVFSSGFADEEVLKEKDKPLLENQCRMILLRHGETEWNVMGKSQGWTDIPLNEKGREQSRYLAQKLSEIPITKAYASALSRAVETAEIIVASHGVETIPDPILRFFKGNKSWFYRFKTKKAKKIQMTQEIRTDAFAYLRKIARDHPGETILVVTHRSVMKNILLGLGGYISKNKAVGNGEVLRVISEEGFLFLETGGLSR